MLLMLRGRYGRDGGREENGGGKRSQQNMVKRKKKKRMRRKRTGRLEMYLVEKEKERKDVAVIFLVLWSCLAVSAAGTAGPEF